MATATVLAIGSEMLDPDRRDANGPHARERLLELGVPLVLAARVEDREATIGAALRAALAASDIVVLSGGLGPTGDDLTREAVAAELGRTVVEDAAWAEVIAERLARRGRELNAIGRRQAMLVAGAERIPNPRGLACGSLIELDGRVVALLPGVPDEFRAMLDESVVPALARRFPGRPSTRVVRAIVGGLPEQEAEPVLLPWYRRPGVGVSILPQTGVLRITLTLTAPPVADLETLAAEAQAALRAGLGRHLVSLDGRSAEEVLGERLVARGATLAVAESCTGGALARRVVSVPGASRYFVGGLEAYANEIKERLLGVPRALLERHGAVSEESARAMAEGARRLFGATYAAATTGVAGPGGGTPEKPVGLVHIAVAGPGGARCTRLDFPVDRATIMELAANHAIFRLWRFVAEE
jgi:nicotinamide-nucleotide amidase